MQFQHFFFTLVVPLLFFSYLTISSLYCAVLTSHVTVLFSHWWFSYFFFLTFDGSIFILCSFNIACDSSFLTLVVPLLFLTFDDFILTFCNSNITCDSFFVTLGGSLPFFSHLTISSSHCIVPTSHVTVLFSHLVVPLLFSHI